MEKNKVCKVDRECWHGHWRFKQDNQESIAQEVMLGRLEGGEWWGYLESVLSIGMSDSKSPEVETALPFPSNSCRRTGSRHPSAHRSVLHMQEVQGEIWAGGGGSGRPHELSWDLLWRMNRRIEWRLEARVGTERPGQDYWSNMGERWGWFGPHMGW